jgi:hypothetical protein
MFLQMFIQNTKHTVTVTRAIDTNLYDDNSYRVAIRHNTAQVPPEEIVTRGEVLTTKLVQGLMDLRINQDTDNAAFAKSMFSRTMLLEYVNN